MTPTLFDLALLREAVATRGHLTLVARGSSMWPAVRDGATVRVEPLADEALAVGMVVAFERRGALVMHRVLGLNATHFYAAGDARWRPDGWASRGQLIGRVRVLANPRLRVARPSVAVIRLYLRAALGTLRRGVAAGRARVERQTR